MGRYEVTEPCYVPVGTGHKFKKAGQVVVLDDADAAELNSHLKSLPDLPQPVALKVAYAGEHPTPSEAMLLTVAEPVRDSGPVESAEEVIPNDGAPEPVDERAGDEAVGG